jgi:hypothetical protein
VLLAEHPYPVLSQLTDRLIGDFRSAEDTPSAVQWLHLIGFQVICGTFGF